MLLYQIQILRILKEYSNLTYLDLVKFIDTLMNDNKNNEVLKLEVNKALWDLRNIGLVSRTGHRRSYEYNISNEGIKYLARADIKEMI